VFGNSNAENHSKLGILSLYTGRYAKGQTEGANEESIRTASHFQLTIGTYKEGNTVLGTFSPANPALMMPEPWRRRMELEKCKRKVESRF